MVWGLEEEIQCSLLPSKNKRILICYVQSLVQIVQKKRKWYCNYKINLYLNFHNFFPEKWKKLFSTKKRVETEMESKKQLILFLKM